MGRHIPLFVYVDSEQPLEAIQRVVTKLGGEVTTDLFDPETDDTVMCTVDLDKADEVRRRLRTPPPSPRVTVAATVTT